LEGSGSKLREFLDDAHYRGLVTALMGLEARLRLARLYLCTDAREKQGDLGSFLQAAFAGGVDIVQIRQKDMKPEAELAALEIARQAATPYQAIVCVNDSAEIAGRFQADMLHLGQADGPSAKARRYLHPWALLGRSTHARRQADKAIKDSNVDYFCVGPVYATSTKPDYEPVGLDLVRYAAKKAPVAAISSKPWFAIGGISMDNIEDVIAAGARRVCVVRAITQAADPQAAADRLSSRLRAAWKSDPAMERYVFQALSAPAKAR
jgi:thiamine-phosphate pyrophosphorylase